VALQHLESAGGLTPSAKSQILAYHIGSRRIRLTCPRIHAGMVAIERGGAVQAIATIPKFFWELSLSIYCIVKGFRPSPTLGMESVTLPESDSALRHGA
jgi:hypothetical protein